MSVLQSSASLMLLAIAAVALIWLYRYIYIEQFVGSVCHYLDKQETAAFLGSDPDNYVKTLTPLDLYARKVGDGNQYISRIAAAARDFDAAQKVRYTQAALQADRFFKRTKLCGIDSNTIVSIPWVFAMTDGTAYEDGLPHTRTNIIFVSTELDETPDSLLRTLVHEKVHLYQRMNPERMMTYLESRGYNRWKQRMGEPRVRANPDVDPWIYIDPLSREPMVATYATDKPLNITDVIMEQPAFEHPYEKMAYEAAKRLKV